MTRQSRRTRCLWRIGGECDRPKLRREFGTRPRFRNGDELVSVMFQTSKFQMNYLSLFRMPNPVKITGRSSTITNSFVSSVIPIIVPTNEQVEKALVILGMDNGHLCCSYCGSPYSEWDHLRPLVSERRPTGYVSEIHNLVPACGKCNQSKGNKPWEKWIVSTAKQSPKSRGVTDLDLRMKRLREYEQWGCPTKINFEKDIGPKKWKEHWENWERVLSTMEQAQKLATEINQTIAKLYAK